MSGRRIVVAVCIFLLIVFLAFGVTVKFNFASVPASDHYALIDQFFAQWSGPLEASATVIVAVLALVALDQTQKSRRIALRERYLDRFEGFVKACLRFTASTRMAISHGSSERLKQIDDGIPDLFVNVTDAESVVTRIRDRQLVEMVVSLIKIKDELTSIDPHEVDSFKKKLDEFDTVVSRMNDRLFTLRSES